MDKFQSEWASIKADLDKAFSNMPKEDYQRRLGDIIKGEYDYLFFFDEDKLKFLDAFLSPRIIKNKQILESIVSAYAEYETGKPSNFRQTYCFLKDYSKVRHSMHIKASNDPPDSTMEQREHDNYYTMLSLLYAEITEGKE
ncbi:MAG: hypothetical protein FWE90_10420 [Defluviitaleaceae bacterium]|nr:hypothetical protein [Defluviitaleaceae bacterium]